VIDSARGDDSSVYQKGVGKKNALDTGGNPECIFPKLTGKVYHMTEDFEDIEINIHEVLSWISSDTDRINWLDTATALKAGNYDFSLFDDWSSSGGDYSKADTRSTWNSINPSAMVRIKNPDAYLIAKAKKNGYQPTAPIKTKSSEDIQRDKADRAARQAQYEREEKANQTKAANKAQLLWEASTPLNDNPYLSRKEVVPAGELRQISTEQATKILYGSEKYSLNGSKGPLEGDLLVYRIGDETGITTCQLIDGNGSKHILKGGSKAGCWWSVEPIGDEVQVAEGMATALSGHEATGVNTIVAVDAGGILSVSKRLRELYPDLKITILGEPDKKTGATNSSHMKAQKAVGAYLAMPTVGDDFNDMHVEKGIEAVREAIESASLSHEIDGNRIDIDSLVTLNGKEMTVYEAINKHQGKKIDHPTGSGKLWVNSYGFSGKGKDNYFRFELIGLDGGKELIARKQAEGITQKQKHPSYCANQYTGVELARCALYLTIKQLKKFGPIFKSHADWIISMFPELEQCHLSRIIRLIDLKLKDRKVKATDRFKTFPKRGQHIHLHRKCGLVQWVDEIFTTEKSIIVFDMEHGTGKTAVGFKRAMQRRFEGKNNVCLTHSQPLTYDTANRIGTEHYIKDKDNICFFDQLNNGVTICLPSIMRDDFEEHLNRMGVFCDDEIESILSCFAGGDDTIFKTYKKEDVYEKLKQSIIKAEHIYIGDADVSEATIQWLCHVKGVKRDDVLHVTCEPAKNNYDTTITYHQTAHAVKGVIEEIIEDLKKGEKVSIPVSSAKDGRKVYEALQDAGFKGNLYAKEKGFNEREFNKLKDNPSEATKGLDFIIYTSLINTGVSIEHNIPHFTICHAIFNNISIAPTSCLQALRRVRYLKRFKLHVYLGGKSNGNPPVKPIPTDLKGFINWQKDRGNADRDLFVEELDILLNKYGFNAQRVGGGTGEIISFKKEDTQEILNAQDIEQPHEVNSSQQWYENIRLEISELFNTKEVIDEEVTVNHLSEAIVESYQTDRHKQIPERYKRLTNNQDDRVSENEALRIARELFNRCLKAKIRPNEINLIIELVKSHWATLRAGGYLPSDWSRRPPKTHGTGTLKAILEWWGLDVKRVDYSGSVRQLEVSLNLIYETIAKPEVKTEPSTSQKNEKRDREIIRLKVEEGLSVRKTVERLKGSDMACSEGTVKNVIKNQAGNHVSNLLNSNTYNTEKIPSCPLQEKPDNSPINTSSVSDISDNEGGKPKEGNLAWLAPKLEAFRKKIEIETQATIDGVKSEPFIHYADTSEPQREVTVEYDPTCPYSLKALSGYCSYNGRIEAEIESETRISFLCRKASNDPIYLDELVSSMVEANKGIKKIKFKMSGEDWPVTINLLAA